METIIRTKRIGGSIGIILPRSLIKSEGINSGDLLEISFEKSADLSFLWGKGKGIKKSTDEIMEEIDEGENE